MTSRLAAADAPVHEGPCRHQRLGAAARVAPAAAQPVQATAAAGAGQPLRR